MIEKISWMRSLMKRISNANKIQRNINKQEHYQPQAPDGCNKCACGASAATDFSAICLYKDLSYDHPGYDNKKTF
jgi:hypothetical protein